MRERELELTRGIFGHQGLDRDPLLACGGINLIEHRRELFETRKAVGLDATLVTTQRTRRFTAVGVQHIKLEFDGHDRLETPRLQTLDATTERMPRIRRRRTTVELKHRKHHLRSRARKPRRARQGAGHGSTDKISIACVPHQTRRIDIGTGDVEA